MAKQKRYHFSVSAISTPFPVDMLRYNRCFPATEKDSNLIQATLHNRHEGELRVDLIGLEIPTEGRWRSLGWKLHPEIGEQIV